MQCPDAEDRMPAWLDGVLPAEDAQKLAGHVAGCPRCAEFRSILVGAGEQLHRAPFQVAPPSTLAARAFEAAMAGMHEATESFIDVVIRWGWRFALGGTVMAAAAAVVLVVTGGAVREDTASALRSYVAASDQQGTRGWLLVPSGEAP